MNDMMMNTTLDKVRAAETAAKARLETTVNHVVVELEAITKNLREGATQLRSGDATAVTICGLAYALSRLAPLANLPQVLTIFEEVWRLEETARGLVPHEPETLS